MTPNQQHNVNHNKHIVIKERALLVNKLILAQVLHNFLVLFRNHLPSFDYDIIGLNMTA